MHIAVDLDGTLAEYHGFNLEDPHHIGKPIPAMLDRVRRWIDEGHKVSIFTARVSDNGDYRSMAIHKIDEWLRQLGLQGLEITAIKQKKFSQFWDDRAIAVVRNKGEIMGVNTPIEVEEEEEEEEIEHNDRDTGAHYRYVYKGIKLDPARIVMIYNQGDPLLGAIVKKALCAGNRGHKDFRQDLKDIICAAERRLEMLDEDSQ